MPLALSRWGVPRNTIPDVDLKILRWLSCKLSEARSNACLITSPPKLCPIKINRLLLSLI